MKMTEATKRTPELVSRLLQVWEDSARATHLFLSDAEIKDIKECDTRELSFFFMDFETAQYSIA